MESLEKEGKALLSHICIYFLIAITISSWAKLSQSPVKFNGHLMSRRSSLMSYVSLAAAAANPLLHV